jgi:hypothetical protein
MHEKVARVRRDLLTYPFSTRLNRHNIAELGEADEQIMNLGCCLWHQSEVENNHIERSGFVAWRSGDGVEWLQNSRMRQEAH